MDYEDVNSQIESNPPTLEDLLKICIELNRNGAKYILIGGMAMIQLGFNRTTFDIDLLVESSKENQSKIFNSLLVLKDKAITQINSEDLKNYSVVRIADEIVIDLMQNACGIEYKDAIDEILIVKIKNVEIPIASPKLLFKMKQTYREKDKMDLLFLSELLKKEN